MRPHAATLLDAAFRPNDPGIPAVPLAAGAVCAISGVPLTHGVPIAELVTPTTAKPHEIFRVARSAHVSESCARLFKAAARTGGGIAGNLLALQRPGGPIEGIRPMISRKSAEEQGREWWADLLMRLPEGTATVAVISDESKKRLWLDARASVVGPRWQLYLHAGDDARVVTVDIHRLREALALCTEIYTLGFGKQDLAESLFRPARRKEVAALGFACVAAYERRLAPWRGSDELAVAVCVVQPAPEMLPALTTTTETTWLPPPPSSTSAPSSSSTSAQVALFD